MNPITRSQRNFGQYLCLCISIWLTFDVYLWAATCPTCQGQEAMLTKTSTTYTASGGSGSGYVFSSSSSRVTVDPDTGEVIAGDDPSGSVGDVEIRVTDSEGNYGTKSVTVVKVELVQSQLGWDHITYDKDIEYIDASMDRMSLDVKFYPATPPGFNLPLAITQTADDAKTYSSGSPDSNHIDPDHTGNTNETFYDTIQGPEGPGIFGMTANFEKTKLLTSAHLILETKVVTPLGDFSVAWGYALSIDEVTRELTSTILGPTFEAPND